MIFAVLLAAATPGAFECDGNLPQQELNMCSYRQYQHADTLLNVEWATVSAVMKEADRGVDRTYDKAPGYFETLLAAQRAWLGYRDHHCATAGFEARGGSLEPLLVNTCMRRLTELRTRELRELTDR